MRICAQCGHEQSLVGEETGDPVAWECLLEAIWGEQLVDPGAADALRRKIQMSDHHGALRVIRTHLLIEPARPHSALIHLLRRVLREYRPTASADHFAQLQLSCLALCSGTICDACGEPICLRCGESDWHSGRTCLQHLADRLCDSSGSLHGGRGDPRSLRWQLDRAKQCPRCFLLTSKDEDGSCNQMRCVYCAFIYCWECLREWSPQCGYYQCLSQQGSGGGGTLRRERKIVAASPEERVEAGVPDVTRLPSFG